MRESHSGFFALNQTANIAEGAFNPQFAEVGMAKRRESLKGEFDGFAQTPPKAMNRFAGARLGAAPGAAPVASPDGPPRGVPKSVLKLGAASVEAEPFATKRNGGQE